MSRSLTKRPAVSVARGKANLVYRPLRHITPRPAAVTAPRRGVPSREPDDDRATWTGVISAMNQYPPADRPGRQPLVVRSTPANRGGSTPPRHCADLPHPTRTGHRAANGPNAAADQSTGRRVPAGGRTDCGAGTSADQTPGQRAFARTVSTACQEKADTGQHH